MNPFLEITPESLEKSPFQLIGKEWMLVTAAKEGTANTMTASWGGLGVMWGKNVAYVMIRPQRYTKEFIDHSDTCSLTFFTPDFKPQLSYLGKVSGRDEAKIEKSGLTLIYDHETPYFEEANLVLLCKKLYRQPLKPEHFLVEGIDERWYPHQDYHEMYIMEIEKVLVKA